jgi:hypothetical protein
VGDIGDYGFMQASPDDLVISRDPARETLWAVADLYLAAVHRWHIELSHAAKAQRRAGADAAEDALRAVLSGLYGFAKEDAEDLILHALRIGENDYTGQFVAELLGEGK